MTEMIKFDMPKNQSSIIKVIGVGGGGSNAVNHMYEAGIKGVDFLICNTDAQSMETSPIPVKIQLGDKGLGAGSIPSVGKEAAHQRIAEIREILEKNTKMLFITAGMGGGTGTGAAPVIASVAKELGILTVGIVTLPFAFEGRKRRQQAEEGIKELRQHVDTLLLICNDKLRELHGDLKLSEAFNRADNVLTTAAKGIAEIITVTGYINVDFEDVKTVMKDSGKAIMGSAEASGENRALDAVKDALSSPLLNDNDIEGASNVLLYIASGAEEISMDEVTEITDYIQQEARSQAEIIWGNGIEEDLGDKISITIIATGFESVEKRKERFEEKKITHVLNEEVKEVKCEVDFDIEEKKDEVEFERIERINKVSEVEINNEVEVGTNNEVEAEKKEEKLHSTYHLAENEPPPVFNNHFYEPDSENEFNFRKLHETSVNEESTEKPPAFSPFIPEEKTVEEPVTDTPKRTIVFTLDDTPQDIAPDPEPIKIQEPEIEMVKQPHPMREPLNEKPFIPKEDPTPFEVYIKKPGKEEVSEVAVEENEISPADLRSQERIEKLRNLSLKLKTNSGLEEMENQPAYMRKKVALDESIPSEESSVSKFSLYEAEENKTEIRSNNSFLHDNVD